MTSNKGVHASLRRSGGLLAVVVFLLSMTCGLPATASAEDSGATDMYRMYNPNSGEHFYTADGNERDSLRAAGWRYEGVGWVAPVHSNTPVYRLYNPNASDHHYTMNAAEKDSLVASGWNYEGIGWYSSDTNRSLPVYRQYNPHARSGSHNYTLNGNEAANLVSQGWRDEGVAWYAVGGASPAPAEPTPAPNPAPAPTPGKQITPGAYCKKSEAGQQGTAYGKIYTCAYRPGNKIPHWYPA
ncbi:peptidase [Bifidobacterium goeldii]|uniref:Peptidase n=1 Tax=Bifidobacterium goeldii TaxID=2306975 RepID=A0A430FDD6_9BIFI|nr:hypothetical protein [Bifidobacterium goeldii]RSX50830.1 peptidase [Bifidobacterium goeldii]